MKAISIKELNSKHTFLDPVYNSIEEVNEHLKIMNKLGFTNTGIYLSKENSGEIISKLQSAEYRVFGELNAYKDSLFQIEWF